MKEKCAGWMGWLVLLVGVIYLLADYNVGFITSWWKLSWFTSVLILVGLHKVVK